MNGPVEIRVTGLDQPAEAGLRTGAVTPLLSAVTPRPDQPSWDVAVWVDMLTVPAPPSSLAFYEQMEQWLFSHYTGSYASVRPEWSKGWAFSSSGAWTNTTMLTGTIPAADQRRSVSGQLPSRLGRVRRVRPAPHLRQHLPRHPAPGEPPPTAIARAPHRARAMPCLLDLLVEGVDLIGGKGVGPGLDVGQADQVGPGAAGRRRAPSGACLTRRWRALWPQP